MENITCDNTPNFTFNGKKYKSKILDIYDGDTITIGFYLEGFNYIKMNIRLMGIDTPELKGNQKEMGIIARNYLIKELTAIHINKNYTRKEIRDLISKTNDNIIDVHLLDFDKYGRPLAYIYKNGININEKLVEKGLANKYDGGKKEDKWLNYLKND